MEVPYIGLVFGAGGLKSGRWEIKEILDEFEDAFVSASGMGQPWVGEVEGEAEEGEEKGR